MGTCVSASSNQAKMCATTGMRALEEVMYTMAGDLRLRRMRLTTKDFNRIRRLVYVNFGINLTPVKRQLVIGRLHNYVTSLGFTSFRSYIDYLERDRSGHALKELINRISTNHSYFFRGRTQLDYFTNTVLDELTGRIEFEGAQRDLRIWSAGCAAGEEPYTLVICLKTYLREAYDQWQAGVLATDISQRALQKAQQGIYGERALVETTPSERLNYFEKRADDEYHIVPELKREVLFRKFNLLNTHYPFKKPFHVIFCRNVMIYFDPPTRAHIIRKFSDALLPGGYLFIGQSETIDRKQAPFEYVLPSVYRKPE